jgi:uncharacterized protein (TIGR04222 family)
MNPFDLPGPQFLLFYLFLVVLTVGTLGWLRRRAEGERGTFDEKLRETNRGVIRFRPGGEVDLSSIASDPYLIAFLRGGKNEALRVAALSLIDRGILLVRKENLLAAPGVTVAHLHRPIEQALVRHFAAEGASQSIFSDKTLEAACAGYQEALATARLMPDSEQKQRRKALFFSGLALLGGVALLKMALAFSRGRFNLIFLAVMVLVAIVALAIVINPQQTPSGKKLLGDLRTLFQSLRSRASSIQPGGSSHELALLAAVYGVGAVSATNFPFVQTLFPKASDGGVIGGACGSSCGSSCGGSCGGGCGGCG